MASHLNSKARSSTGLSRASSSEDTLNVSHRRFSDPKRSPSAKRSPSILVTDARKGHVKAPFAGHRLQQIQRAQHNNTTAPSSRVNNALKFMRPRQSTGRYANISVTKLTSNISDIPSSARHAAPRYLSAGSRYSKGMNGIRPIPQFLRALPSRTSKSLQRLVLIPDEATMEEPQPEPGAVPLQPQQETTTDNIFLSGYKRTRAESMSKEQRELEYPRVTAYLIAEGFNLNLTSKFLKKYHHVLPRLYDDMLYVSYSLPLLPGDDGYRVKSNDSARNEHGNELMEQFIDRSEEKEHHYEFYSGEDVENNAMVSSNNEAFVGQGSTVSEFNPSEPQYFVSTSPAESAIEEYIDDENEYQSRNLPAKGNKIGKEESGENPPSRGNVEIKHLMKRRRSKLPNLSKHAEMFILNYGVVVFWNFSEIHEKNVLADLAFAKIDDDEFSSDEEDDDKDDDDDGEDDDSGDSGESGADGESNDSDNENDTLQLLIKPVPEQDIEMEDFHFEYNKDVPTPRIFNDMITLKSGDHLIKLTISHAIAQSTKLSMFESKMSLILNSISKLPKIMALTGRLKNYTSKKLLMKTGGLLQLRSEVNLSSNVLDTPEYFWSIEPGLHPLYVAIREYLEIDQRVEVLNDRCKVFLDFFDIVSDTLAENHMVRVSKILIIAIGLSLVVSVFEIVVRFLLIHSG